MDKILQNPLKSFLRFCMNFTIFCDFDAILLGFCLFWYSATDLSRDFDSNDYETYSSFPPTIPISSKTIQEFCKHVIVSLFNKQ